MDSIRDQFHDGRRQMIDAFVRLSDTARDLGIDEDAYYVAHGQFFDGNVEVKKAFRAAVLLAEIRRPARGWRCYGGRMLPKR